MGQNTLITKIIRMNGIITESVPAVMRLAFVIDNLLGIYLGCFLPKESTQKN